MGPGGVSESILHFAGYLHIDADYARHHPVYDGGGAHRTSDWVTDRAPHGSQQADTDEMPSQPFRLNLSPAPSSLIPFQAHPFHALHGTPNNPHTPIHTLVPVPTLPVPGAGGGLIIFGEAQSIDRMPTPDQALVSATQVNFLNNNDTVLMVNGTNVTALHNPEVVAHFQQLWSDAQNEVPSWLPQNADTAQALSAVVAHDAALHSGDKDVDAGTLHQGVTVDGVLQPEGTALVVPDPTMASLTFGSHNGMLNPGTDAQTGGNLSLNYAAIVDAHHMTTSLAVFGDAYTVNAIVQTNVLASNAQIEVGGPTAALDIVTDGNVATNGASFATHDLSMSSTAVAHFSPTANVHVDRIDGDFYDIKALQQINYLSDNDTIVQASWSTYYAVDSGHNSQINLLSLDQLADSYDLVVVQGSLHNSNIIYQQNVLLNDDIVKMFTARADTDSQSINTGDNTLQNSASIDLYGNQSFSSLSSETMQELKDLANGKLDPGLAADLESNGSSTLHVLYVTGDFYDINFVSQTNIVGNQDTVVQALPNTGTTTAPTGEPTTSTQSVDSGHNQLANVAGIAVGGTASGFQAVGGQHYDDAILVQANLVTDTSKVTVGDTHTLANEVVAFTGVHDVDPTPASSDIPTSTNQTDPTVNHDLFHGVMS